MSEEDKKDTQEAAPTEEAKAPDQTAEEKASSADAAEDNGAAPTEDKAEEEAGDSAEQAVQEQAQKKVSKNRGRHIPAGIAHIKATFNNTVVSITDMQGGVIAWSNAGRVGFKGSRKSTAFAATLVAQEAARQAASKGMREVEIRVQGAGAGRESAIRAIQSAGLNITVIKDITPMPHNGCRPRKRRRV